MSYKTTAVPKTNYIFSRNNWITWKYHYILHFILNKKKSWNFLYHIIKTRVWLYMSMSMAILAYNKSMKNMISLADANNL